MEIIKVANDEDLDLKKIAQELKLGKTIIYPTETCYGLGCDATNERAVDSVFKIKKRQKEKTVLVLMSDVSMADDFVKWNPKMEELAQKYWPGPLTLVAPAAQDCPLGEGVVAKDGTLAFRVTAHPIASGICEALGAPIVSTSANTASLESPYDPQSIIDMYDGAHTKPDIFIDAGELPEQAPSTIVRVAQDGSLDVLRQGEIIIE